MIVLHTLGDTLITIGDRNIRPSSPLVFASLLYLATERGRRVPRTALQELLFPEAGERSGAHSLRQLLYKLRQLGAPLEADATSVYLSADHVRDDAATTGASHSAVISFLPDFEPDVSERYSEWLELKRAEFAASIRKRLVASIEANRESLNWQAVERDAQLLLSIDPFNEVGTFALAEAAALSGGKAAALRILSDYERETGRTDLRLPASLLRRRISQAVPDTPVPTLSALPFVGRDAEVKELRKYIARARAGQPCLYVIGGEAGIGKSRLLAEVAALAALEGMSVFTVRCQSHYGSRPLSVFIELVPDLRHARGALGVSPQAMQLLSSLTRHTDDKIDAATDTRDDITRSQVLRAAIRDLVDAVAGEQPLLIAVEDAHWADHDSMQELNALVQGLGSRTFIVVITTRTLETFSHSASVDDRTVLRRLRPLGKDSMNELAGRLLPARHGDDSTPNPLVSWTVRTSGGNPLFLQMLCGHYAATGEAYTIPPDVTTAVVRRVEHLPDVTRRVLAICALLGNHATIAVLRTLTAGDHLRLFDAIHQLEEEGYLGLADNKLLITHDLLSEAVMSLMPPASRCLLHGCVATALERQYESTNDAGLLWDCAEQWSLSGESDKALQFLLRCARHATDIGRATEALNLLARARRFTQSDSEIALLEGSIVLAARAACKWHLAFEAFGNWTEKRIKCTNDLLAAQVELAGLEAQWFTRLDAPLTVPRTLRYLRGDADPARRVEAARLLVAMAHELCDPVLAREAYETVKPLLDARSTSHANRYLVVHYHCIFGDRELALRLARKVIMEIDSFAETERLRVVANTAVAFAFLGEHNTAYKLCMEYAPQAEALGALARRDYFLSQAVAAMVIVGNFDVAEALHQSLATAENPGIHDSIQLANEAELAIWRGDAMLALRAVDRLSSLCSGPRLSSYVAGVRARALQLDPQFRLESEHFAALLKHYEKAGRFVSCDGLVQAITEDLLRRGAEDQAKSFVVKYLESDRRELGPVPNPLSSFASLGTNLRRSNGATPEMPVGV